MPVDPDAMWKPGFVPSEPPEAPDRAVVSVDGGPSGPPTPARRRSRARRGAIAVLVLGACGALAAFAVAVVRVDRGPAGPGVIPSDRRLPSSVAAQWTTVLPSTGQAVSTELEIGDDLVVVVVDDGSRDRSSVVGLEAATGTIRWRRNFVFAPPDVRILDLTADHVVLEQVGTFGRRLFGLATTDGSTAWELDRADDRSGVVLGGSAIPSRVVHAPDDVRIIATEFVDPATGALAGVIEGRPLSSDLAGTWLIGDESGVVAVELSTGWTEPVVVADTGVADGEQLASVDGRLVVLNTFGALVELVVEGGTAVRRPLPVDGTLPELESIFPTGGSTMVGAGRSAAVGLRLDGDVIRSTWQIQASVRSVGVTSQGVVLSLSEVGAGFMDGIDFIVVDAATGRRLAGAGPSPSYDQLPLIVGDGFVITQVIDGAERIGFALDGTELWRLPAIGKLRIGDGVVATLTNSPAGFEIALYGAGAGAGGGGPPLDTAGTVGADG